MTLLIIGDFKSEAMKKQVASIFGKIENPKEKLEGIRKTPGEIVQYPPSTPSTW